MLQGLGVVEAVAVNWGNEAGFIAEYSGWRIFMV